MVRPQSTKMGNAHLLRNVHAATALKQEIRDGRTLWLGDPMEVALYEFARRPVFDGLRVIGEVAFDGDRRRMSVIVEQNGACAGSAARARRR